MPVYVIDTLKPKNGLDFPVVEAVDVAVEGYASLADAVTHFATDTAITALTANLQAQIDQIAQAAGTGSADTEVAQARVDAEGTTFQTLKARLDTEQSYTNEALEKVGYKKVSFENANDYYIIASGEKSGTSDTYNSVDVELLKGEKVVFNARGYSTSISMIALNNGDNTYKPLVRSRSSDIEEYTYTAINDCTVTLSYDTRASFSAIVVYSAKNNVDALDNYTKTTFEKVGYKDVEFNNLNEFYINTLGQETASSDFNTVLVDVGKGDKIDLTAKGYSTSIAMISIKKSSTKYTVVALSRSSNIEEYIYTAETDCTIALCFDIRSSYSAYIVYNTKGEIDSLDTKIDDVSDSKTDTIDFNSYVKYNGDSSRPSVNMYNYTTAAADTRLSSSGTSKGRPKSAEGYHLTDYIAVSENDVLFGSFAGIGTNVNGFCTYNEDKVCIDYHTFFGAPNGGTTITDEGTAFIRIEMKDTLGDYTKYQVQKNEVTPLEPYGEKIYYKGETIITIKSDGTGDYTSIREAFETEGDGKTYHIYPGEYEVSDDFTAEEIASASYSSSGTGFVGIRVPNDSEIIGIGSKYDIVVKLTLDPDTYSYSVRSNIATLNLFGNCHIENLTVIAENARTPIHDDFQAAANCTHIIQNCELKNTVVERTTSHGYGLGMRSGATIEISDCNIYPTMIIHSNANFTSKSVVRMNNTNVFSTLMISDAASVATTEVYLNNTSFGSLVFNSSDSKMHLCANTNCQNPIFANKIEGSCIIKAPAKNAIEAGQLVRLDADSHDIVHAYPMSSNSMQKVGIALNDAEVGAETKVFLLNKYVSLGICKIDSENASVGDKIAYADGTFTIDSEGDFGEIIKYGTNLVIALY